MHRWKAVLLAVLVTVPAQAETVYITAARMVDVLDGRVTDRPLVAVTDGRITSVTDAAASTIPAGATVIDLGDRTLLPGLIDMHVHLDSPADIGGYRGLEFTDSFFGMTAVGNARAMLSAERCALNLLQTLCATATLTRRYVDAVAGTGAKIMDTRKTLPGLRIAQKYAVKMGGGHNQRIGLFDGVLIKENHIAAAGGIGAVMEQAFKITPPGISIQIEVETLAQLDEALDAGARLILLDNFSLADMRLAVSRTAKRAELEASGGITLENVRNVAESGVDRISIGALTKDIEAADLSMRFER